MKVEKLITDNSMEEGEDHFSNNAKTPLKENAFEKSDDEKILIIQEKVTEILQTLGMDLTDDSLKGTPLNGWPKCLYNETFGVVLHPDNKPKASTFDNSYTSTVKCWWRKNITLYSTCEHHSPPHRRKSPCCLCLQWNRCRAFSK